MSNDVASLIVKVDSKGVVTADKRLKGLEKQSGRAEKATTKLTKSFGGMRSAIAAVGIGLLARKIVNATKAQEQSIAQLNAAIASTGMAAGLTSIELQAMAAEMQNVSTFGDETIMTMQAVMLTFTKIGKETFPRATQATIDLATRMGTDLKSAALQVGKALNDPIRGLDGLGRAGIQFTDQQKDLIKSLAATGEMAKAQSLILKELETQFGGSAKAARETFGGAIEGLGNAFGDLMEADGNGLVDATEQIESLTKMLGSSETKAAFNTMTTALITLVGFAADGVVAFTNLGVAIGEFAGDLVTTDVNEEIVVLEQTVSRLKKSVSEVGSFEGWLWNGEDRDKLEADLAAAEARLIVLKGLSEDIAAQEAVSVTPSAAVAAAVVTPVEVAGIDPLDALLDQAIADEEELTMMSAQADAKLALQQDYWDRLFDMETGSQEASLKFADAIRSNDLKGALKVGSLALSNAAKQGRAMFSVQKALALANAAVTLPSAVIKSFENGGGYPWGLVPAALMAAQGAAQIASISGASFGGGGGSAPSVGGGGGTSPPLPTGATATPEGLEVEAPPSRELVVTFPDDSIHSDAMRQFLTGLNEVAEDMGGFDKVVFG